VWFCFWLCFFCVCSSQAEIIIWDFERAKRLCDSNQHVGEDCIIHRLSQHLGRVQDLAFSFDSRFLASLGGRDDNAIVIWDAEAGQAICGAPAASEAVKCVKWYNNRSDRVITAGTYHVKVWFVDFSLPKLHSVNANMGSVRRVFECISVQEDDTMVWCGSQTGDVVKLKLDDRSGTPQLDGMAPPTLAGCSKDRVSKGVSCIHCIVNPRTGNTNAVVGGGDGAIVYMNTALNIVAGRRAELMGGITAMAPFADGSAFYCGTDQVL
jgi:WD40 repeat protein